MTVDLLARLATEFERVCGKPLVYVERYGDGNAAVSYDGSNPGIFVYDVSRALEVLASFESAECREDTLDLVVEFENSGAYLGYLDEDGRLVAW